MKKSDYVKLTEEPLIEKVFNFICRSVIGLCSCIMLVFSGIIALGAIKLMTTSILGIFGGIVVLTLALIFAWLAALTFYVVLTFKLTKMDLI